MSGYGFKTQIARIQKRLLPHRRIRAKAPGLWFTGLLATMGFLTLLSENNILFLLLSCQIAVVIISGVLSEYSVSHLDFDRHVKDAHSEESCGDLWILRNRGLIPAFNVGVGEWVDEKWVVHAVCKIILPGQTIQLKSPFRHPRRGHHSWDGIACGSDFPFGFSDKIRIDRCEGASRLIWPARDLEELKNVKDSRLRGFGSVLREGEIRNLGPGEVWTDLLPFRRSLDGSPLARSRSRPDDNLSFEIDLDSISPEELEKAVRVVAGLASLGKLQDLHIHRFKQTEILSNRRQILDRVALIRKEGAAWTAKTAS